MTGRERSKVEGDLSKISQNPDPSTADIVKVILGSNNLIRGDINNLSIQYKQLQEEQNSIKNKLIVIGKNNDVMLAEMKTMKLDNEYLKQNQMKNDVIITVPKSLNISSLSCFIEKLSSILEFDKTFVDSIFKKKNTGNSDFTQIVVKFMSWQCKNILMQNKKSKGPLLCQQLDVQYGNNSDQIFIRERITSHNIELLKKLNKLKIDEKISSCWFKGGAVYMKTLETDEIHRIQSEDEICSIINSHKKETTNK